MTSVIRCGIAHYHPNCRSEHPLKCARGTIDMPWGRRRDLAAATLFDHSEGAAGEVAEAVGEVAVVSLHERVVAEIAVLSDEAFAQNIVAQCILAQDVHHAP